MEILFSFAALLVIVAGIALVGWGVVASFDRHTPGSPATIPVGIIVLIVGLFLSGIRLVPPGSVGVVVSAGVVNPEERGSGFSWVVPFVDDVINFSVRTDTTHFENLGAASREYQDVFITGYFEYAIAPDGAAELYKNYRDNWRDTILIPNAQDALKAVTAQFGIADILPKREEIRVAAIANANQRLAGTGITVTGLSFANVNFNEEYNLAIQNKQIQELQIQTERNILEQRRVQAEQNRVAAQGEANAAIERAKGVAESNRLVAESLTQPILTQMAIEKFNPNVRIILMPPSQDGGGQFIFPPDILNEPETSPSP